MMTHDEELHDQIAALALGVLAAPQARAVCAHLDDCKDCQEEYHGLRAVADTIGLAAEIPPDRMSAVQSARMKSRISASVRSQGDGARAALRPRAQRSRSAWFAYAVAAAAILLATVSTLRDMTLDDELATSNERLTQLHDRINDQSRAAAEQNARIADLFAADSKHYSVQGGEVIRHGDRLYLAMRSLPKLPAGRVFQAWTLAPGSKEMAPSITFTPNRQGMAIVQLPLDASKLLAVAVSIEPEGGSKAPTTAPTFVEKLTS